MNLFKRTRKATILSLVLILSSVPNISNAEYAWVVGGKIVATLADSAYGGCMVLLDVPIAQEDGTLASCPSRWVSLDCDLLHHTQSQSNAMWTSALVAFSLQKTANFYVNDDIKFNGYCMARRIDVHR